MKNFFKKLSFVLALALLVSAIAPAGKAQAATAPTLKKSSKVLYIGGDKTGNIGDTYRFTFNNAAGYTATWKSSKKTVATVDAKSGNIQAVGVGSSSITATLTNKAGKAVELVAKVYVKQNAEKIGFGSLAAVKEALAVGDTAKVNVYRQVGTTKVWAQSDKTVSTDVVKWTTSDANVATVDKWGKVTAVAAGKATITATATQTEGSTAVVSKSFDVTVQAGLTAVKQTGLNTIEATFAGDLSAVANKDNVKVYSMVGSTPVVVVVKEVKFSDTDKTKATITTYVEFTKDTQYKVEYKDTKAEFKGADTSKDAVASIKIDTTTVEPLKGTTITFKVFDKNGVDITKTEFTNRIDVSFAEATTKGNLSGKVLTMYAKDTTVKVKASYHTYTYGADYKEITIDAIADIVCQPAASTVVTGVNTFTTAKVGTTPDFATAKNTIAVNDNGTYFAAVQTKDSKGNTLKSTDTGSKFKFSSSDATTLIVDPVSGKLFPVKEGGAQIIVKYDDTVVAAFNVIIGAKRVAYDVATSFDKTTLTSGATFDEINLTVEVKDQYGDKFDVKASAEFVTGDKTVSAPSGVQSGNKTTFKFEGENYVTGSYQYKVKAGDQVRYVYFTVDAAKTVVDYYKFSNAGKSVDTALTYSAAASTATTSSIKFDMLLESFGSNGYKMGDVNFYATKTAAFSTIATTGTKYYIEVLDPNNDPVDVLFYDYSSINGTTNKLTIKPVIASGSSLLKLSTGNYTVKAYSVYKATSTQLVTEAAVTSLTVSNFVVNDSQVVAVPNQKSTALTGAFISKADLLSKISNTSDTGRVLEVKVDGNDVTAKISDITYTGAGKDYIVTKIVIDLPVNYADESSVKVFKQSVNVVLPFTFAN